MRYLRQNTSVTIVVGPFVDWSDGKTLLCDNDEFVPADIVCELVKGNSSSELTLSKTGGNNNINLTGNGLATLELTVGNVDTSGSLRISFTNAIIETFPTETILAFVEDFMVLPANVYDSLMTDKVLAQQETSDFIKDVLEADAEVDVSTNPWQLVIKHKTTGSELIRKDLKDVTGVGITSAKKIIGQHKEPG